MRRYVLNGLAAALLLLPAGACSGNTGALSMGVRLASFQTTAVPTGTKEIRVGVAGESAFRAQFVLSPTALTRLVGGVPTGPVLVGAVAYGANGQPLGGGRATAMIRPLERTQAVVVIAPGAVDEALIDLAGRPAGAVPSPSASAPASGEPIPGPSTSPSPGSGTTEPVPTTSPSPIAVPTVTATPFVAPTANTLPGGAAGGGGALATPTPTPTPPTGAGVTVLPGNPYTGPVTITP